MTRFIAKTRFAMREVQRYKQPLRKARRLSATLVESKPRCQRIESCSERFILLLDSTANSNARFVFIVHSNKTMGRVWKGTIESLSCLQKRGITPGSLPHGYMPSKLDTLISAHLVISSLIGVTCMFHDEYTHLIPSSLISHSYRLVRTLFATTTHWISHDPFLEQKVKTFRSSGSAIRRAFSHLTNHFVRLKFLGLGLAETIIALDEQKDELQKDETALKTLLGEMMHMCLWGNATVRQSIHTPLYRRYTDECGRPGSFLTDKYYAHGHPTAPDRFEERTDRSCAVYTEG